MRLKRHICTRDDGGINDDGGAITTGMLNVIGDIESGKVSGTIDKIVGRSGEH